MAWCNCCEKETGILYFKTVVSKSEKRVSVFVCETCLRKLNTDEELIEMMIFKFNEKIAADIDELLRKLNLLE